MKKFMVLYMASAADFEKAMKGSTPEQQKKGMDAWMKWMEKNKKAIADGGAPLGKTKRVDGKGTSNIRTVSVATRSCTRNLTMRRPSSLAKAIRTCR